MARKKKAVPFAGKETVEEEAAEHKLLKRAGKREKAGAGGVASPKARLALTLRKIGKRRRGRQYRR